MKKGRRKTAERGEEMETEMRDEEPRETKRQMEDQSAAINTKHVCNAPYQVSGSNGNLLNLMPIMVSVCSWCCQRCLFVCVCTCITSFFLEYLQGELKLCLQSLTHQSKYHLLPFNIPPSSPPLVFPLLSLRDKCNTLGM